MHAQLRDLGWALLLVAVGSANSPGEEQPRWAALQTAYGSPSTTARAGRDRDRQPAEQPRLRLPIALVHTSAGEGGLSPAAAVRSAEPLSLPRRTAAEASAAPARRTPGHAAATTGASLAIVLGLFLLLVWFQRRTASRRCSLLPGDVFETLGRVPLNARQEMHLVRVGNKLLLLAVTATGAETLTEITEPREIARLSEICRHSRSDSMAASFREILSQLSRQPPAAGLNCVAVR